MTSQDLVTLALLRWDELRKQGKAPKERLADPDIQKYAAQLDAVKGAMEQNR